MALAESATTSAAELGPTQVDGVLAVDAPALRQQVIELLSDGTYPGVLHGGESGAAQALTPLQTLAERWALLWPYLALALLVGIVLWALVVLGRYLLGRRVASAQKQDPLFSRGGLGETPTALPVVDGQTKQVYRLLLRRAAAYIGRRHGLSHGVLSNQELSAFLSEDKKPHFQKIVEGCEPIYYGEHASDAAQLPGLISALDQLEQKP